MEDVLDLYKLPYDPKKPLVNMDELCKQLTKETRVPIPRNASNGINRYDHEYERNGVANIFLYIEPLTGRIYTKVTRYRKKPDWAKTIKELVDEHYPEADKILLVLDNLNTHVGSSLYETYEPAEAKRLLSKIEFHYTPKHGSWLNIAEIGLSILSRQCLKRRIPDIQTLDSEVSAWTDDFSKKQKKINWRFTTAKARIKLKRLYPSIEC